MKSLLLALLLTGCSTQEVRLLTVEQDRRAAEACRGGCVVVPAAAWGQIQTLINTCVSSSEGV